MQKSTPNPLAATNRLTANSFCRFFIVAISVLVCFFSVGVKAQSTANYAYATAATGSLALDANANIVDMTAGTTSLVASASDQGVSTVTNIGFTFWLNGNPYSQFTVSANGVIQLGSTVVSTTTYVASGGTVASPRLGALTGDMATASSADGGGVTSKLIGTAPNRCLVIQWVDYLYWGNSSPAATWQVRLYESGLIEYVYGSMVQGSSTYSTGYNIGFSTGTTTNSLASIANATNAVNYASFTTNNVSASTAFVNLNSSSNGSRRVYSFTPTPPIAPTALNFTAVTGSTTTLNWTDNSADEIGFAIYRSTDNINFTYITTTAANAVNSVQSGLSFGTTYYWKVYSVKEVISSAISGSQTTIVGSLSGIKTVGTSGDYTNLTTAFAAITASGLAGNVELHLIAGYPAVTETYPIASSGAAAVGPYTVLVYPSVSGLSITSSNATGTLNLNNAANIIFDGRVNQTGSNNLIISNSSIAATAYAVQFVNDASNNTIKYCNVRSSNTGTASGTIVFGTTTGANGNDNNTVSFCNISEESAAAFPTNGIYAAGTTTTTAQYNDNNSITNNNVFNFFNVGTATNGIFVSTGNNSWTISGNSVYQTASRTYTTAATHTGINIASATAGNNFTVTNNFIGGSAASAGGTAYTMLGAVANIFRGITINVAATTASSVQGNTITNIAFTTSSGTTTLPGIFTGINVAAGLVNVGTTTGNTIGAATGNNAIVLTSTTTGGIATGIYATSAANLSIQNNNVGSISTNSAAAIGHIIQGINVGGSGSHTVSLNSIGSASTINSISCGTSGTTTATCDINGILSPATSTTLTLSNNTIRNLTAFTTGATTVTGIYASATVTNLAMNSNTVSDLRSTGASGAIYGLRGSTAIYTTNANTVSNLSFTANSGATASTIYGIYNLSSPTNETISNNQLSNFSIAGASTSTGNIIAGIYHNTTAGTRTVNGNTINGFGFTNTSTGSVSMYGIFSTTSSPSIFKNKIYDLAATNGAASVVYGIYMATGTTSAIYNNLIGNLTASASGLTASAPSVVGLYITSGTTLNVYNNTINITGSSSAASFTSAAIYATSTPTTINLRNNIFVNNSTPGSSGKTIAYQRNNTTLTNYAATSNNNLLYAGTPGGANLIYFDGTNADQTLAAFKTRMSTRDGLSITENPPFLSTTGSNAGFLHINTAISTLIESSGAPIALVTDDYDGDTRNATKPDIGADEFAGLSPAPAFSNVTVPTAACTAVAHSISADIVPTTGTITSVTLNYNNGSAGSVAMSNSLGNTWTGSIPAASPDNTTVTWSITATNSAGISATFTGASYTDAALFTVPLNLSANPSGAVCSGTSVTLTASLPAVITVGTQSTTESIQQPYRSGLGLSSRHQYLYLASELSASGINAGSLTGIGFTITSLGSGTLANYSIKLSNVTATVLTSTFLVPGASTTVYNVASFPAPVTGLNSYAFSTPFIWDGTSNVLVDICYDNTVTGTSSTAAATTPSTIRTVSATGVSGACTATSGSTGVNRPLTTFNLSGFTPYTVTWNDGVSNFATTPVTTVAPTTSTTYTFTITSIASGCTKSATQTVSVNPLPAPPTTLGSTQCGLGIPSASASGSTNGNYRWYTVQTGGTAISGEINSVLSTTSISTTTTFYVSINSGTCESVRTPVTASVNPPDAVAASSNGPVCGTNPLQLTATVTGNANNNNYTYTWSASPATGSGIATTVSGGTGSFGTPANTTINPTATGTYTYTVTANDNIKGCITTATVVAIINAVPVVTSVTSNPNTVVCTGSNVVLSATSVNAASGTATVGTDNASTKISTTAVPYRTGATIGNQYKSQYLLLASELTAAGITTGNLTSLAFTVASGGGGSMSNLTFRIANTAATSVTSTYLTPTFTTVLTLASYTPVIGVNSHTFTTAFPWDGTSNIVVDVCGTLATSGSGCTMATMTTAVNTTIGNIGSTTGCADATGTLVSLARPVMTFGGQVGTNQTASLNWSWNPGSLTGSTVTVTPASTTVYTVTATNPTTSCSSTSTITVTTTSIPAAPTVSPSTQCGQGIPTVSASGTTNGNYRWYTVATAGTAIAGEVNSTLGTTSISATTTYYVSISNSICEGPRTAVIATVTQPDALQASSGTTTCVGSGVALTATVTSNSNNNTYSYTWSALPATGSGIPTTVSGGAGSFGTPATITVTPTVAGTYTYIVAATGQGCNTSSTVVVTVGSIPVISNVTANPNTAICAGSSVQLTAVSILPVVSLGAGTTTTATVGITPFGSNYEGARTQYLVRASELSAIGLSAGNITSLGFDVTAAGAGTFAQSNFAIKIATTAQATLNGTTYGTPVGSFTTVFGPSTVPAPAVGIRTFTFATPFNWDGTSNLLIDICHDNDINSTCTSCFSSNSTVKYTATAYNSVFGSYSDNAQSCGLTAGSVISTFTNRPNMIFGNSAGGSLNWSWNPGALTGATVTVNPPATTTYTVTATNASTNCSSTSTITVTVTPLPAAPGGNNSIQCGTSVPTAFVSSNQGSANSNNMRWYSAQTGGTLLQTGGYTYTTAVGVTTTFWVSELGATCESARTAVTVSVNPPDPISAASNGPVCVNTALQLTTTVNSGTNGNIYNYTWSATPATGSGIATSQSGGSGTFGSPATTSVTPTLSGTYTYTVTGVDATLGCTAVATVVTTIKALPTISGISATPSTVCAGATVALSAISGSQSSGAVTVGAGATTISGTTTGTGSPYNHYYGGQKTQFIYTKAELNALGMSAGNITALAYNLTALGSTTLTMAGFTINIGHTTQSAATTTLITTGLTQVYANASQAVTLGSNSYTFSTPFNWNNTDNIVVSISWSNNNEGASASSPTITSDVVSFVSSSYIWADLATPASLLSASTNTGIGTDNTSGTASKRPKIVFTAISGVNNTANNNWVWNPGNLPGNTVSVNPTQTTTYTVTATDIASGCSNTSTVLVNVNPLPPVPSGNNGTDQCGTALTDATVSSNSGTASPVFKWYSAATSGTLLQTGTSPTYLTPINVTTSFYVSEISAAGCEGPRVEITTIVSDADLINISATPATVCIGGSTNISATYIPTFNSFGTFDLTATGGAASGVTGVVSLPLNETGDGTAPYSVTPTAAGTYTYTITASDPDKGCTSVNTVVVTVVAGPPIATVTATPAAVCAGASVTLSATTGAFTPGTAPVGTSTTTLGGVVGNPYRAGNGTGNQIRTQLLYTAAELTAAGLTAGNITSIGLTTVSPSTGTLSGFTIKMGTTTATTLSTTFLTTPTTTVFTQASFTPLASGLNTHTFSTPFNWNGTSNIVIDFCQTNSVSGTTTVNAYTPSYASNTQKADGSTSCTDATGTTVAIKPVITFGGLVGTNTTANYNWSWNPGSLTGSTVTVTPASTTVYTVTATSGATGCSATATVTATVNPLPAAPISANVSRCGPGSVTLTATGAGGTLNWYSVATGGTSLQTGASYTTNISINTSFWVEETTAAGCIGPRTQVNASITPAPALTITPSGSTSFCQGNSVGLTASGPGYVNFTWSVTPSTAGGLSSTTGATVTATPTLPGSIVYTVNADDNNPTGCASIESITLSVNPAPVIATATATPTSSCAGGTVNLAATTTVVGAGVSSSIGAATTGTSTPGITPYNSNYEGSRTQYLVRASELTAAGLNTGNITSVAFYVTTVGAGTFSQSNFTIKMAHTAATAISGGYAAPTGSFTTVLNPTTVAAPNTGLNTLTFDAPFVWDGNSNIIIDICHDNDINASCASCFSSSSTVRYSVTAYNSVYGSYADNIQSCGLTAGSVISTFTNRPNMIFGGQVATGGAGSLNWTWNPGNLTGATVSVNPTSTTSYTVTATNPITNCSSVSAPVTVTIIPVATTATATPSTPVCAGTSVTLNGGATGAGTLTYAWTSTPSGTYPGTASITVAPTVTTSYTLTVTDPCAATASSIVTVTVNPLPTASIQEAGPITLCSPATQVLTAVTNAASPAYQWTLNSVNIPGATGSTYTVSTTSTGAYRVIVTNGTTNCVSAASAPVTVNINPQPSAVTITPALATICAGASQVLTASGGTISSLGSGAITGTPTTTQATTGSPYRSGAGANYQIKQQMLVTAAELNAMGIPANTSTTLNSIGFTTPATASGAFVNFEIRIGNTTATTLTSTFLTSPMTLVFTAASYTPVANSINTHSFSTPFVWDGISNVVIETRQTNSTLGTAGVITYVPAGITNATNYVGSTTGFAATTGTTATFRPIMNFTFGSTTTTGFTWSPSTGLNTTSGATVSATPTVTTTYTATATSAAGCTNASTAVITFNPRPTGVITGTTSYCTGQSTTTNLSIAVTGAGPWTGTLSGGTTFSGSTSPITVSVTPVATTTYTIATLNGSACSAIGADLTGSATITVNPTPATPTVTAGGATTFCSGGSVILTSSSATGNQWNLNGSAVPGATNQTLTVTATGNYSVTVTNGSNCSATSTITAITVNPTPATPTLTAGGATTFCSGGSVILTSSSATGNQWNLNGSAIPGATNQILTVTASGNYSVTVTNGSNCSATSTISTITVNPTPATPTVTAGGPTTFCSGGSVILTSSSATGNQWNLNGSAVPGATNQILTVTASGNYSVTVTNGSNCSATSAITTVTVNPTPATPTVTAGGLTTFCSGGSVILTSSAATGNQWNLNGSAVPGATNQTLTVTASGNYSVTVTNESNCSATSTITTITVNPTPATPTVTAGGPTTFCSGGSVILTSSSATGNQWNLNGSAVPGATNQTLTVTSTGNYSVTVTNESNCSATSTISTITVNPTPATPTVTAGGATTFCSGGSVILTSSAATGNQWNLNGSAVPGATNQTLTVAASGNYSVTVTNESNCSATSTITAITVNPTPATPTVTAGGATTFCSGGSVILTSSSATGNQWNLNGSAVPGATNQTLTVTASGNYSVTVTNESNCSATSTITAITVNPTPATPTVTAGGATTFCSGGSVILTSSAATGNQWNLNGSAVPGATNQTLTVTASGNYSVTVTNGSNCSATSTITAVTVNPAAANPTATVTQPTCAVATGTITVTAPLGAGTTYSLNNGPFQSSVTFSGVAAGTHILSVQTSSGCFSPANTTVTVDAQPITPAAPTVTGTVNVCPYLGTAEQITYTATAAGATTYTWTLPPNVNLISGGTGTDHITVTFNTGFSTQPNKQIRVTAGSTCGTSAMTIYYLLTQFPVTPNPISGPTNVCALIGTTTVVSYTTNRSSGAISYAWSVPSNTTVTHPNGSGINDTTINVVFNTGFTGGGITVTAVNGCGTSGTRTTTIVNTPASVPGLISGPTNVCANIAPTGTAATYSVTAVAFATSYTWTTPANTTVTHPNGSGASDYTITVLYPAGFTSGTITVTATNGCGTSAARSLTVTKLNPATPGNIDVIQTHFCGENGGRIFTYSVATMPANATSVQWTVPTAGGAVLVSGQGTTSITVSYPDSAITGTVTAQAVNNCGVSSTKTAGVRLPACPPPSFTGVNNAANSSGQTKNTTATANSQSLEVKIFPNPTVSDFKLEVLTSAKAQIHVRILDGTGRLYKTFTVQPYEVIALGAELKTGAYLVEVRQGETVKTTKVIKF